MTMAMKSLSLSQKSLTEILKCVEIFRFSLLFFSFLLLNKLKVLKRKEKAQKFRELQEEEEEEEEFCFVLFKEIENKN